MAIRKELPRKLASLSDSSIAESNNIVRKEKRPSFMATQTVNPLTIFIALGEESGHKLV